MIFQGFKVGLNFGLIFGEVLEKLFKLKPNYVKFLVMMQKIIYILLYDKVDLNSTNYAEIMFYYTVHEARDIQELETSPDAHILIQITRSIDTAASHHKKSYIYLLVSTGKREGEQSSS